MVHVAIDVKTARDIATVAAEVEPEEAETVLHDDVGCMKAALADLELAATDVENSGFGQTVDVAFAAVVAVDAAVLRHKTEAVDKSTISLHKASHTAMEPAERAGLDKT